MSQGHGDETDPELPQDINTNMAHPARVTTTGWAERTTSRPTGPWPR